MTELRDKIADLIEQHPPRVTCDFDPDKDRKEKLELADLVIALIQKEQGWRDDMESAPRDGTRILLSHGKPVKNAPRHAYMGKYLPEYDQWLLDSGSPVSVDQFRYWMPIEPCPTPPQGEDG